MNNKIYKHNFSTQPGSLDDTCFYGRDEYIIKLHEYFNNNKHCALRADRQYGKTALGYKAIQKYKTDNIDIIIDLNSIISINNLRNKIMKIFVDRLFGYGASIEIITKTIGNIFAKLSDSISGRISAKNIQIAFKDINKENTKSDIVSLIDTLILINFICERKNKKVILFLDEIHYLLKLAVEEYTYLANLLRTNISKFNNITFIIAGSELTILDEMIDLNEARYLMQFEKINVLGIKEEYFIKHLKESCKERNKNITDDLAKSIVQITGGIASTLSYFGIKILENNNRINILILIDIIFEYLIYIETEYKRKLKILNNINHGKELLTLIINGDYSKLSGEDLSKYDEVIDKLESKVFILEENGLYLVADPLFVLYMNNNTKAARTRIKRSLVNNKKVLAKNNWIKKIGSFE